MAYKQVLLALVAVFAITGIAYAGLENGALSVSNVSISPSPVMAGSNVVIRFHIYNSYDFWLYNVYVQPTGSYPLLNVSPTGGIYVGRIDSGLNQSYFNYTVAIPNTTPSGVYTVTFTATYYALSATGVDIATSSMPISFYVQNRPVIKLVVSRLSCTCLAAAVPVLVICNEIGTSVVPTPTGACLADPILNCAAGTTERLISWALLYFLLSSAE